MFSKHVRNFYEYWHASSSLSQGLWNVVLFQVAERISADFELLLLYNYNPGETKAN